MGRRFVALIAGACTLGAALASARSEAAQGAEGPFRDEGAIELEGELRVNGRRVQGTIWRTRLPPSEAIARHREMAERSAVDVIERPIPGGRILSILDVRGGRHAVVVALDREGWTEVIRGESPLGEAASAAPLELPDGWIVASAVEDRIGGAALWTATAFAPLGADDARQAIDEWLVARGWTTEGGAAWRRGKARLSIALRGDGDRSVAQFWLQEEAER